MNINNLIKHWEGMIAVAILALTLWNSPNPVRGLGILFLFILLVALLEIQLTARSKNE